MKQVLIGSTNQGKILEVKRFLGDLSIDWLNLCDIAPNIEVDENRPDFEGNAVKKAVEISRATQMATLAADGGMVVPALGGWPGVRSRRFDTQVEHTDEEVIEIFKNKIRTLGSKERKFEFHTVFAFVELGRQPVVGRGVLSGDITLELHPLAQPGFPYRRFWWLPKFHKYFLDLTDLEYDQANHNGHALRKLRPAIERYIHD
ncbi:hypothetical protein KC644_00915 [Candidatus Berkelbacteria bacterium]|nr:hypothetical protein [Candidatus Berkelbacteria bacterium]MCB0311602.1 hypothetical protein [Bdellovibrionales bacterium]